MLSPATRRREQQQRIEQERIERQQQQREEFNIIDRNSFEQKEDEMNNLGEIEQSDQMLRNERGIARSPSQNLTSIEEDEERIRRYETNKSRYINNSVSDTSYKKRTLDSVKSILDSSMLEYQEQIMSLYERRPKVVIDNILLKSNTIAVNFVFNYLVRNNISVDGNEGAIKELVDNIFFSTLTTILEGYEQEIVNKEMILSRLTNMFNENIYRINKTELNQLIVSNISIGQSLKPGKKTMRWQGGKSRRKYKRKQSKKYKKKNTRQNKRKH